VVFLNELRYLAKDCGFGEFLNSALRDIFVIGLRDERVQRALLSDGALTLDSALKTAVSMETASHQSQQLRQSDVSSGAGIHAVISKSNCWRCYHGADSCYYRNLECHCCRQKGHKASTCKKKKGSWVAKSRDAKKGKADGGVHFTESTDFQEDTDLELCMLSPESMHAEFQGSNLNVIGKPAKSSRPLKTQLKLDGHPIQMEIDTGAAYSIISEDEWGRLKRPNHLQFDYGRTPEKQLPFEESTTWRLKLVVNVNDCPCW